MPHCLCACVCVNIKDFYSIILLFLFDYIFPYEYSVFFLFVLNVSLPMCVRMCVFSSISDPFIELPSEVVKNSVHHSLLMIDFCCVTVFVVGDVDDLRTRVALAPCVAVKIGLRFFVYVFILLLLGCVCLYVCMWCV